MATRVYTRTGDGGETGLFGGRRVSKDDLRVAAYGDVDELNAWLGLAAGVPYDDIVSLLGRLQALLFELGADLATPPEASTRPAGIEAADIEMLEQAIDELEAGTPPLDSFVLPAGAEQLARIHVARTICRRAERSVVALRRAEPQTAAIAVTFLNRLGDLLFVVARAVAHRAGIQDTPWRPR
jgi:cob(I)alamin adenosyltransferase